MFRYCLTPPKNRTQQQKAKRKSSTKLPKPEPMSKKVSNGSFMSMFRKNKVARNKINGVRSFKKNSRGVPNRKKKGGPSTLNKTHGTSLFSKSMRVESEVEVNFEDLIQGNTTILLENQLPSMDLEEDSRAGDFDDFDDFAGVIHFRHIEPWHDQFVILMDRPVIAAMVVLHIDVAGTSIHSAGNLGLHLVDHP